MAVGIRPGLSMGTGCGQPSVGDVGERKPVLVGEGALGAGSRGALAYRFLGAQRLQLIPLWLVPQQAPTTQLTTSVAPKPVHVPEKVRLTLFELSPLLKLAGPFSIGKRSLQSRKVL